MRRLGWGYSLDFRFVVLERMLCKYLFYIELSEVYIVTDLIGAI